MGGIEKTVYVLAKKIVDSGHECVAVYLNCGGVVEEKLNALGVRVYGVNNSRGVYSKLRSLLKVHQIIRNESVSVVHSFNYFPALFASIAIRMNVRGRVNSVITFAHQVDWISFVKVLLLRSFSYNAKYVSDSRGLSKSVSKKLMLDGKASLFIPNPILYSAVNGLDSNKFYGALVISTVSTIRPVKNIKLAVDVAKKLDSMIQYEMKIAGDGPMLNSVKRYAGNNKLSGNLSFLGHVDDVMTLLKSTNVLLITSKSESLPVVLQEAFSAGVVVVSMNVGEIGEYIRNGYNGFLIDTGDDAAEQLVSKILLLHNDRVLLKQMSLNALDTFNEYFSNTSSFCKYLDLYNTN